MRLLTRGVAGNLLNHTVCDVVTGTSDNIRPSVGGTHVAVVNLSSTLSDSNDNATTTLTYSRHQCHHCAASGCSAPSCGHSATCRCRHEPPNIVNVTSAVAWSSNSPTDTGSTGRHVIEPGGRVEMDEEDDEEACTTTSGSYSAGDLCDEIDQLFFAAQNCNRISAARPPNDAFNLSN